MEWSVEVGPRMEVCVMIEKLNGLGGILEESGVARIESHLCRLGRGLFTFGAGEKRAPLFCRGL